MPEKTVKSTREKASAATRQRRKIHNAKSVLYDAESYVTYVLKDLASRGLCEGDDARRNGACSRLAAARKKLDALEPPVEYDGEQMSLLV